MDQMIVFGLGNQRAYKLMPPYVKGRVVQVASSLRPQLCLKARPLLRELLLLHPDVLDVRLPPITDHWPPYLDRGGGERVEINAVLEPRPSVKSLSK